MKGQIKTKLALHSNILRLQKAAVAAATAAKGQAAVSILILGTGRHQLGGMPHKATFGVSSSGDISPVRTGEEESGRYHG